MNFNVVGIYSLEHCYKYSNVQGCTYSNNSNYIHVIGEIAGTAQTLAASSQQLSSSSDENASATEHIANTNRRYCFRKRKTGNQNIVIFVEDIADISSRISSQT